MLQDISCHWASWNEPHTSWPHKRSAQAPHRTTFVRQAPSSSFVTIIISKSSTHHHQPFAITSPTSPTSSNPPRVSETTSPWSGFFTSSLPWPWQALILSQSPHFRMLSILLWGTHHSDASHPPTPSTSTVSVHHQPWTTRTFLAGMPHILFLCHAYAK